MRSCKDSGRRCTIAEPFGTYALPPSEPPLRHCPAREFAPSRPRRDFFAAIDYEEFRKAVKEFYEMEIGTTGAGFRGH